MKTLQKISVKRLATLAAALFLGASLPALAQTGEMQYVPRDFSFIPVFASNSAAMNLITNLLNEPQPELSVPQVSQTWSPPGTYWTLKQPVPLPMDMFPDLPVYEIATNQYLIDDRSVDYAALAAQQQAEMEAEGITNPPITTYSIDTNGLWIQVPTNSLATPHYFNVNVMNTIQEQPYDILTKADLLASTWATELTVTGAVGNITPVTIPMNNRTNLFVRARTSVSYSFYLVAEPLNQDVFDGDTVTFSVDTGGNTNLTFQWTLNGTAISGATNSTYTIYNVQDSDAGYYACIISDGTNSLVTTAAQLTTEGFSGDASLLPIVSSRQNYTFKSGMTYYIGSPIQLYGNTTIEAGAVLKFDFDNSTNSSLLVMGGLTCKTTPYNPAILTSIDDDSAGEWVYFSSGSPQTYITGIPYLDMTSATSNSISNLRFLFADWGVTTPVNTPRLDVWDCQFGACNYGVVNLVAGSSTNSLHNVLFAACEAGLGASSNSITIQGEQVTADVADFCLAASTPNRIALTNSIVWGNSLSALTVASVNVAMNPDNTNFVSVGEGNYYLAANSPLHHSGTANISERLQTELQAKTTYPPLAIADGAQIGGQITLSPQVSRYTNGAPDIGYYYDALDYTVGSLGVAGGTVTVLPGTAIGIRNDYISSGGYWTIFGFYVNQGGSIISHGTPAKPNIFAFADLVQETPNINFAEYQVGYSQYAGDWLPGIVSFVTDFEPGDAASPTLDFRFSNFFLPAADLHFCSGLSFDDFWIFSASSSVNLNLQDCSLHNGQVNLGQPDGYDFAQDQVFGSGAVTWKNTLFENVSINLDPTFYENGADDQGLNVDLSLQAYNNLFRGGQWLHLEPIPASAGNWLFEDNLFDQVNFIQDINQPLDFDYNGNWALTADSVGWDANVDPWSVPNTNYLQTTITLDGFTDGHNEQFLAAAPPYQFGTFGNYYLPNNTVLYGAGSTNAAGVGLYHYTTQTNQFKEGSATSGHMVNIGLHYIAANSYGQPMDSDNDGIPDYVENWNGDGNYSAHVGVETDWQNPMSDGINPDPSNSVYLDIDLSGDGLVGRIKAALGINPLNPSNPLALQQVITGQEPDIVSFQVPISYSTITNIGNLSLNVDGVEADFYELDQATNGNCLLEWNTTYNSPGFHYLSANFTLAGSWPDTAVLSGQNSVAPFLSTNVLQFFESDTMFDGSGAYLDAQLPEPDANYTIQLYDPSTTPPTFIKGITNSTSSGMIQETWDLTYDDGVTIFTNTTVTAVFNVNLLDPASGTHTKTLHKLASNEQGNGFDFAYFYTPTNSSLTAAFGDIGGNYGEVWNGMQAVVDTLLTPQETDSGSPNNYDSSFDNYTSEGNNTHGNGLSEGWPGYVSSRATVTNSSGGLYPSMADGTTKNFYGYGHGTLGSSGSGKYLASYNYQGNAYISSAEVANLLGNHFHTVGGLWTQNPYRFVFMDGCATMDTKDWRRAFGIFPLDAPNQAALNKVGSQAFVGWAKEHAGNYATADLAEAYTETLDGFYENWMDQVPLAACIQTASDPRINQCPLPVPGNEHVKDINGNSFIGETSKIYVSGHSGLTRSSVNTTWDNYKPYVPPVGNE
jgi:hypothetical protein